MKKSEFEVTRLHSSLRTMRVSDFIDLYDGDMHKALEGLARANFGPQEDRSLEDTIKKRYLLGC